MAPVLYRKCSVSLVMGPRYACDSEAERARHLGARAVAEALPGLLPVTPQLARLPRMRWLRTLFASMKYHDASPCFCGTQRP